MSIKIDNLVKKYGDQTVLDRISFSASRGEILGFLGPNGAGKTTTMKIITAYTSADSGDVSVCGLDVRENPMLVKRKIGYLPEQNPLYGEMYVREYLRFIAELHRIPNKKSAIDKIITETGLSSEQNKKIKMLSKGFKQRVGLAQALMHDPEVLILDEPTSGLDPNQLEDIRHLIRELGKEKTVIFSTHIMQEVQALCDRVVIINNGIIVADDKIEQLEKYIKSPHESVIAEFEKGIDDALFLKLKGYIDHKPLGSNQYEIFCDDEYRMRKHVFDLAKSKQLPLIALFKQDVTVENVFHALTK